MERKLWLWDVVFFQEIVDPYDGSRNGSDADFALSLMDGDMYPIEAAVDGLNLGRGADDGVDSHREAMLDLNGGADRHLAGLAEWLQGVKAGSFHQANHIRGGIDGRKLMIVRGQGVLELHTLLCRSFGTDGNLFDHKAKTVSECEENGKRNYCREENMVRRWAWTARHGIREDGAVAGGLASFLQALARRMTLGGRTGALRRVE